MAVVGWQARSRDSYVQGHCQSPLRLGPGLLPHTQDEEALRRVLPARQQVEKALMPQALRDIPRLLKKKSHVTHGFS